VGPGPPSEGGIILPALRRLVPNLLLACATLLALALALEGALRVFWPQHLPFFSGLFVEDRAVGLRHAPQARGSMASETGRVPVRINSRGYRGREYPWDAAGSFRILALGDSFTFGFGVEEDDAWPARLERSLARLHAEVINAALAGMGPDNEGRLLAADGPGLRPDLVLVGFFVGNDLLDVLVGDRRMRLQDGMPTTDDEILQTWYRPLRPGSLGPPPPARSPSSLGLPIPFKSSLRQHSHAYRFLTGQIGRLRLAWQVRGDAATPVPELTPFHQEAFCLRSYPAEFDQAWTAAEAALLQMKSWCEAHGARLGVVAIPTRSQVDPEAWAAVRNTYRLHDEDFDREKPQRILAAFAAENGIPLIDLLPTLRAAHRSGGAVYFTRDTHWNPRGHAVAADEIGRRLGALGLLRAR
jgi:SGNH hydrolase-like domain, acetyltransferase AlgX